MTDALDAEALVSRKSRPDVRCDLRADGSQSHRTLHLIDEQLRVPHDPAGTCSASIGDAAGKVDQVPNPRSHPREDPPSSGEEGKDGSDEPNQERKGQRPQESERAVCLGHRPDLTGLFLPSNCLPRFFGEHHFGRGSNDDPTAAQTYPLTEVGGGRHGPDGTIDPPDTSSQISADQDRYRRHCGDVAHDVVLALVFLVLGQSRIRHIEHIGRHPHGQQVRRITAIEDLGSGHPGIDTFGSSDERAESVRAGNGTREDEPDVGHRGIRVVDDRVRSRDPAQLFGGRELARAGVLPDDHDARRLVHLTADGFERIGKNSGIRSDDGRDDRR